MPEAAGRGFDPRIAACTWFGTGRLRPAPGTWGSVAAGICAWLALVAVPAPAGRPVLLIATLLAAECGSELLVRAEGKDAVNAVQAVADLVQTRFGELDVDA